MAKTIIVGAENNKYVTFLEKKGFFKYQINDDKYSKQYHRQKKMHVCIPF